MHIDERQLLLAGTSDGRIVVIEMVRQRISTNVDVAPRRGVMFPGRRRATTALVRQKRAKPSITCMVVNHNSHMVFVGNAAGAARLYRLGMQYSHSGLGPAAVRWQVCGVAVQLKMECSLVVCLSHDPLFAIIRALLQAHTGPVVSACSLSLQDRVDVFCSASGSQIRLWTMGGRMLCWIGQVRERGRGGAHE